MEENEQIKKVFISYSWTTPKHEEWVLSLAEKLTADGVEVIIDKWDLKKGQDKYVFMEQMVTDKNLDKVLIICDEGYCESLEQRKRVLCLNRLSLQADLLIEREKYRGKSYKEDIVETDIILYYISLNNKLNWFPRLYIFHNRYDYIKFIKQMERKSYFDKVKILFNVNNVEEFKKLIIEPIFNEQPSYPNSFGSVPRLVDSINLDNLCKYQ